MKLAPCNELHRPVLHRKVLLRTRISLQVIVMVEMMRNQERAMRQREVRKVVKRPHHMENPKKAVASRPRDDIVIYK